MLSSWKHHVPRPFVFSSVSTKLKKSHMIQRQTLYICLSTKSHIIAKSSFLALLLFGFFLLLVIFVLQPGNLGTLPDPDPSASHTILIPLRGPEKSLFGFSSGKAKFGNEIPLDESKPT